MTLASALSVLLLVYYFYKQNNQKKFYIQKIEKAFFLSLDIQKTILKNQTKASYNRVTEITNPHGLEEQLSMLVSFYISAAKSEHDEYVQKYKELIEFYKIWLIDKEKVTKTEYNLLVDNMSDALDSFQDKLQDEIKRYI